mmetsp:Transcript_159082/g.282014  ORF Transcript_159082/g.282014 Transcript_159082/m.282014 type:complete len:88 (-) Transcript_159082:16-279(-)
MLTKPGVAGEDLLRRQSLGRVSRHKYVDNQGLQVFVNAMPKSAVIHHHIVHYVLRNLVLSRARPGKVTQTKLVTDHSDTPNIALFGV